MKLTYLLTTADSGAGTERALITQANWFASHGHDAEILSIYKTTGQTVFPTSPGVSVRYLVDATDKPSDLPIGTYAVDRWGPSSYVRREADDQYCAMTDSVVPRAFGELNSDIVVSSTPVLTMLALRFVKDSIPVVCEEHRATPSRSRETYAPLRNHAGELDALVSLTDRSTEWLRNDLGPTAPRLLTIPNAIPDVFYPRTSLSNKLVIAAGRFVGVKNFAAIIRCFGRAAEEHPDWKLRIYGAGPQEQKLRGLVRTLNLENLVEIAPPVPDLLAEWSKASVFAMASRGEGLPLVIQEAAAAGLPLVAYDCDTGPAEIIDDGVNGFLVPDGDESAFTACLSQLMGDAELRERFSESTSIIVERFSPDKVGGLWLDLFTQLREEAAETPSRADRAAKRGAELAASRNEIEDALPASAAEGMVRDADVIPDLVEYLPERQRSKNLELAADLLESSDVPYRWLAGMDRSRHALAIDASDRTKLEDAIGNISDPAVAVHYCVGNSALTVSPWFPGRHQACPQQKDAANVIRLSRVLPDHPGVTFASHFECDIEMWTSLDGVHLEPPRKNRLYDLAERSEFESSDSVTVSDRIYPAFSLATDRLWNVPDFPIDAVYTWVDDTDPVWQEQRAKFQHGSNHEYREEAVSDGRFRNRDELRYSLRSLRMYAPWIRRIYLVTAGQRPGWLLDDVSGLTVVNHADIFVDSAALPTFNSHAIESQLHHIDGLSEHFLYLNDDVLFGRPQFPDQYFLSNGMAKFFPSPTKINNLEVDVPPHLQAGAKTRTLIKADFGHSVTQGMLHTPLAHRKSVLQEMEERYESEFAQTSHARFRSPTDIALLSSFAIYYAYSTQRSVPSVIRSAYLPLGAEDFAERLRSVSRRSYDSISLGEPAEDIAEPTVVDEAVRNFLEEQWPIPSPWEETR